MLVSNRRYTVVTMIGAHDRKRVAVDNRSLEGRKIRCSEFSLAAVDGRRVHALLRGSEGHLMTCMMSNDSV